MGLTSQVLLLLVAGICSSTASELVPVYMWQTIPTKGFLPAVSHVSEDTFTEILQQRQAHQHTDRIVIFAEQSLSPEDFSAQTFYELRQLADHTRVTYLPTVATPMQVLSSFVKGGQTVSVDDIIKNPKLLETRQLIIDLDDAKEDEDRVDMLKRHSKFISEVCEKVSASRDNVLAVYTGRHSSWIVPSEIVKQRQTRAASDPKANIQRTKHYLLFVNGTFMYTADGKDKNLTITQIDETPKVTDSEKAESTESTGTLIFKTDDGDIVLNWIFDSALNWVAPNCTYKDRTFATSIHAPQNFSYSCNSAVTLRSLPVEKEDQPPVFIRFPLSYQLQYFPDGATDNSSFDDSYDCVGFTSPAIWSGLFVTFIFAIILSLGLAMIMDIKTMDRFDDPKGKTIVINASE